MKSASLHVLAGALVAAVSACAVTSAVPLPSAPTDAGAGAETGVTGPDAGSDAAPSDGGTPDVDSGTSETAVPPMCAAPTFTPDPTAASDTATPFAEILDPTVTAAGGTIFYTTDGTNPSPNSVVYAGPVYFNQNTTFRAAAKAPGCDWSEVAVAAYTIPLVDCGGAGFSPTFTPTSQPSDNDFLVAADGAAGDTICYTLDGTVPTCNAGVCTGTSETYNASSRIAINGTVTSATTGQVTVTAITCMQGSLSSAPTSETYTLQAAPPTMSDPAPSTSLAADAGTIMPTLQSATLDSIQPQNAVQIWTTTSSSTPPTCSTGTAHAGQSTVPITGNTSIQALTCKPGYLPSAIVTFDYGFGP